MKRGRKAFPKNPLGGDPRKFFGDKTVVNMAFAIDAGISKRLGIHAILQGKTKIQAVLEMLDAHLPQLPKV